jgi:hypothetical protein
MTEEDRRECDRADRGVDRLDDEAGLPFSTAAELDGIVGVTPAESAEPRRVNHQLHFI